MVYTQTQLTLCQANDAKSQRELYDLFKARVMGLCRRYAASLEEAEDVFQETFIRIFQNIDQLQDVNRLEQWIKRIAVNASVNYYYKNRRHLHSEERSGYHHPDGEYELILAQLSDEQLIQIVNNLDDRYRLVFNLFEVEGYSHAEIAELLGIPEGTSRSQLNRAKHILKNKLKAIGVVKYEKYG